MPTIKFKGFSQLEKSILAKTFKANSERLDMHNDNFTVYVSRVPIQGGPKHYARVAYPKKDLFVVELNDDGFNLFDATSALGHEAVHMKQYRAGRMKDSEEGVHWNDNLYRPFRIALSGNDVPWEKEAWALQGELHKHAVESLSPEHRKHIKSEQSHGLNKLW